MAFAACGDDAGKNTLRDTGDAGAAGRDGSNAAGGSSAASSNAGSAGTPAPSMAGGEQGGEPGGGGQGSAGMPATNGLSADDFCELLTVRARQWLRDCRNLANAEDWWGTINIDQFCESGRDAIAAGRLEYDAVQAKECAAMSVGLCGNVEALAYGTRPQQLKSDVCAGVVTGTVALGDECHPDSTNYADECAEGYCAPTACPSTCTAYAEEDDDCDGVATLCDPSTLFCNAQSKCQPFLEPGSPCPARNECGPGAECVVDEQNSACTTLVAVGQPCEPTDVCADGAVCADGECRAKVALGDACRSYLNCPEGAFCSATCIEYFALNEDCTIGPCGEGLVCVDQVCVAQGQVDDDCPCEVGLWCDETDTCRAPGDVGDDCTMEQASSCPVPLFCHPQTLKCTEKAAENESCSMATVTDSCQAGLHCVCTQGCGAPLTAQGTCQPRLAGEADCTAWHDCLSSTCTQQTCVPDPLCY